MKSDEMRLTRDELKTVKEVFYKCFVSSEQQLLDEKLSKKALKLFRRLCDLFDKNKGKKTTL